MTVEQFKAWFEGFSEGISFAPDSSQWARIKEKVDELGANKLTYRISPGDFAIGGVVKSRTRLVGE